MSLNSLYGIITSSTHTHPTSISQFKKHRPRGMEWGGRREEDSGWGTHEYLWWIHVDIWQNLYNIVKLKNKIKKQRKHTAKI